MAKTALFAKTIPRALAKLKMMYTHASGDSIVRCPSYLSAYDNNTNLVFMSTSSASTQVHKLEVSREPPEPQPTVVVSAIQRCHAILIHATQRSLQKKLMFTSLYVEACLLPESPEESMMHGEQAMK